MRRILVISMAAAIPAVLPMNASEAQVKPRPQAAAHGKTRAHNRSSHHFTQGKPHNDVQVSTDDPGNEGTPAAPGNDGSDAAPGGQGSTAGAPGATAHGRKAGRTPRKRSSSQSRPSTGPDTGFSIPADADMTGDMDNLPLPAEAAEVLKELGTHAPARPSAPTAPGQVSTPDQARPGQKPVQIGAPEQARPGRARSIQIGAPETAGRPAQARQGKSTTSRNPKGKGSVILPAAARIGDSSAGATRLTLRTSTGHTVMLRCDPPGGSHPKAEQACQDVAKSGGDLQQLPAGANPRACFMIYAPVTVSAQGDWRGQPVRFRKQYPNTCVMRDKTGSVFDF